MEGFLPFSIYGGPVCAPAPQAGGLGKRQTRFLIPQGLSYLELCKSILSQVGPALPAPPRSEATTRECGVQVNGQVDKLVQCSLGPKTLLQDGAPAAPCGSPEAATPPIGSLRFYRPVSIYSPRFDGRLSLKSLGEGAGREAAAEQGRSAADAPRSGETLEKGFKAGVHQASKSSSFQFLEQRYGFFHCKKCNIRWESAYVWCISGTSKVYYKQLCRKCQVGFNPYRVESIVCKGCSQTCCSCEKKQRHINMKRPHRQDLCCRCKGMRLSCDATYSFKYIV